MVTKKLEDRLAAVISFRTTVESREMLIREAKAQNKIFGDFVFELISSGWEVYLKKKIEAEGEGKASVT